MHRFVRIALVVLMALLVVALLVWMFRKPLGRRIGISLPVGSGQVTTLYVPQGFGAGVYATGLAGPRFMAVGPDGTLYVAERGRDRVVALPDRDGDGQADAVIEVAGGLDNPTSLDFYQGDLYVGEAGRVTRLTPGPGGGAADRSVAVPDLPTGGVHVTRTVLAGPQGQLYVSAGSTCNVCREDDPRRAAVWQYAPDGSGGRPYTVGLRNAVGLALNPWTGEIWATNNGRDLMGDDRPPETVYALADGADAGWPRCHAGDVPDPQFGQAGGCAGVLQPLVRLQAHMAPLGLAFYTGAAFPPEYRDDLYIALHGSWNRSRKVGYKVMRVPLRDGRVAGPPEDFATGWLQPDESVTGRPAGIVMGADGSLLISDDMGGIIYRIYPVG